MKNALLKILVIILFICSGKTFAQDYWLHVNSPTTKFLRSVCFLDSLTGWVAGDSAAIFFTSNGGATWTEQDANTRTNTIVDIFFLNRTRGWAISWETGADGPNFGSNILTTSNGGLNWFSTPYFEPDVYLNVVTFTDSLNGRLGGFPGNMVYTTDGGASWAHPYIDSAFFAFAPVLDYGFYNNQYGFASGGYIDIVGVMWRTTNYGLNWHAQGVGPEPVQAIHIFDSLNIIAVGGDFEYGSGVVKTTDGGDNWLYTSLEVFGIASALSFRSPAEGWAPLGFAQRFVYTLDSGNTWDHMFTPDSVALYDLQFTDKRNGYAVGDRGVILKYNSSLIGIQTQGTTIPKTHTLFQNYPNPFNPSTTIKYELRSGNYISLKVYDLSGREIVTLKEGYEQAGQHELGFTPENLSTGVYIYKLSVSSDKSSTPDYTESRKMILVK